MALTSLTAVRAEHLPDTPFGGTMNKIRTWLDSEKIEPKDFKTVMARQGLGFEIRFKSERDAERFQHQFPSLVRAE
jgi:hypothetical protein